MEYNLTEYDEEFMSNITAIKNHSFECGQWTPSYGHISGSVQVKTD